MRARTRYGIDDLWFANSVSHATPFGRKYMQRYLRATKATNKRLKFMSEAFETSCRKTAGNSFRVKAPLAGDVLSSALHRAYDDRRVMPEDFALLLAQLDRIDTGQR